MEVSAGGFSELAGGGVGEETEPLLSETQLSPPQDFAGAPGEVEVSRSSWRDTASPVSVIAMNKATNRTIRKTE